MNSIIRFVDDCKVAVYHPHSGNCWSQLFSSEEELEILDEDWSDYTVSYEDTICKISKDELEELQYLELVEVIRK